MSSLSKILLVSALFGTQSLVACGGSTDSRENSDNGDSAGQSNDDDSSSAGAAAGGRGNTAGAGSTGGGTGSAGGSTNPEPAPNGKKLSEIKSDAQALALCNRIKDSITDSDLQKMHQGSCALTGQTGAAAQLGTCEELQAECASHTPVPSTNDGSCTADDIPDCDNVTVDEYVACTRGTITMGIEYLSKITCDTDLESLQEPGTASACTGPFARCPEYAAMYQ